MSAHHCASSSGAPDVRAKRASTRFSPAAPNSPGRKRSIAMADWDPALYHRFRAYRAEPFELILARLPLRPDDRIIDLGCGTGENTIELARRVVQGHATGLDSSPAMIAKARAMRSGLDPKTRSRVAFIAGDFAAFDGDRGY